MINKVLLIYEFPKRKPAQVAKTNRELFGYTDKSHHGRYSYWRNGTLSGIMLKRITKSTILTDKSNDQTVFEALKKAGAIKITRYYIRLNKTLHWEK
jgi:plasmid replication initiation protein